MPRKTYNPGWTLIVDTREQLPFDFRALEIQKGGRSYPLEIDASFRKLDSGDYSIDGYEDQIAVERKSPADLVQTISRGRQRFIAELERLQQLEFAAVVVECEWMASLVYCNENSKMSSVSLDSSILAFNQRYPKVHWYFRDTKENAAKTAFKILHRFWSDKNARRNTVV